MLPNLPGIDLITMTLHGNPKNRLFMYVHWKFCLCTIQVLHQSKTGNLPRSYHATRKDGLCITYLHKQFSLTHESLDEESKEIQRQSGLGEAIISNLPFTQSS